MWASNNICTPGHLHVAFLDFQIILDTNVFLRFELSHTLACALAFAGSRCIHKTHSLVVRIWLWPRCRQREVNVVWQYWVFYISSTKPAADWRRLLVSLVTTGTEHIGALKGSELETHLQTSAGTDVEKDPQYQTHWKWLLLYTTLIRPLTVHWSLARVEQPEAPVL